MPILNGYQISETIFSSRFTQVFRACRDSDGLSVILRTGGPQPLPSLCARLSYVADVLKKFQHPNISALIEWVDTPGQCWLVMEDIQAIDLRHYLERFDQQRLPLEIFWPVAIQLAEALSIIHHQQVIHKDLHPRNIVVNPDTLQCQIIDFGLASLLSREQPTLTSPNQLQGSLSFLSPEQTGRMNRSLDYRTDFYTLGATLYLTLTGRVPFDADDALGLVYAHMAITQTPVKEIRPDVPQALSDLIDKLLSKNAEDRYQSAQGLKHDLESIRDLVVQAGSDRHFILGSADISGRFMIPQRLYGREQQVAILLEQFTLASEGSPRLLLIEGYSGVGKSVLVHEIHKSIAERGGLFLEGKFNQFQQNAAYLVIRNALESWLTQILSFREELLHQVRDSLLNSLSSNARVLIDFVPNFKYLLGDLPVVPKLGSKESQARFHYVMKQFFQAVTASQPLVLFVDDLQWADLATLNLIPELLNEPGCHLLIIAAYRDNEVDESHPLHKILSGLTQQQSASEAERVTFLNLSPLGEAEVRQLLADTFVKSVQDISPLAKLILEKTNGNPFFTIEFIRTLYTEGLVNFDLSRQSWDWDLSAIEQQGITDNVAALMLNKMQHLPEIAQDLLRTAACLGNRFTVKTLARLVDRDEAEVMQQIWPALEQGVLLQEGGSGLFASYMNVRRQSENSINESTPETTEKARYLSRNTASLSSRTAYSGTLYCRFLHDRMLQAAYESIPKQDRPALHLKIGRILLADRARRPAYQDESVQQQSIPADDRMPVEEISNELALFDIVEHMNQGIELIHEARERLMLAQLNQLAADKALDNSVWQLACHYSETAISLLPENAWETQYALSFEAHKANAESYFLMGHVEQAEQRYEALLTQCDDPLRKAEILAERLVHCIGKGQWLKGSEYGEQALALMGIEIPLSDQERALFNQTTEREFHSMSPRAFKEKLNGLKQNSDKAFELAMYLLPNMCLVSGVMSRTENTSFFSYFAIKLMLEKGHTQFSALVLACFALEISRVSLFELNRVAAEAALDYMQHFPDAREQSNTYNLLATGAFYIFSSYDELLKLNEQGEQVGLRNGEQGRADINYFNRLFLYTVNGLPLDVVHHYAREVLESGRLARTFSAVPLVYEKLSASLVSGEDPEALDEERFPPGLIEKLRGTLHEDYVVASRAYLAFWYEDTDTALAVMEGIYVSLCSRFFAFWIEDFSFLLALLLAMKQTRSELQQSNFDFIVNRIDKAKNVCSSKYAWKKLFLQAELSRQSSSPVSVTMKLYEQAIEAATGQGSIQFAALANERYADYLQEQGFERFAQTQIEIAYRLYSEWGCAPKIRSLSMRYPLLRQESDSYHYDISSQRYSSLPADISLSRSLSSNSGVSRIDLDVASIMKSAQVISGELALDSLIAKVMDIILENTGAQLGALVLLEHNKQQNSGQKQALIAAYINHPAKQREILRHEVFQGSGKLPESIIRLVLRSGDTVNLENAFRDGAYTAEAYVKKNRCKSILCVPVVYRDERIGVLYLENNVSSGAFTDKRLKLIAMLLSQAAISLENARLYQEVMQLNIGLEQKVEARTRELALANEELKAFNYTVSHDLRSPLRALTNYSHILLDEHAGQLKEDALFLLQRIHSSATKMSELVAGLLDLSRIQGKQLERQPLSLTDMAREVIRDLHEAEPDRVCDIQIAPDMQATGDKRMIASVLENLLGNAWKYSAKKDRVEINFGVQQEGEKTVYYVRDHGAGFDMRYRDKLFHTFQRLHHEKEFAGTGIGLATVKRIVNRHGGEVWADAEVDYGATFYFTLG